MTSGSTVILAICVTTTHTHHLCSELDSYHNQISE